MDVRRAEGECGSAVSGLGLISHYPRRVCIPLLSSGLSTSYRFVYLIVLSFLLLLPCIISVCPLFFTLVFSSLFWFYLLSKSQIIFVSLCSVICTQLLCFIFNLCLVFVLNPPQPPTTLQILNVFKMWSSQSRFLFLSLTSPHHNCFDSFSCAPCQ